MGSSIVKDRYELRNRFIFGYTHIHIASLRVLAVGVGKATADYPRSAERRPRDAIGSPSTGSAPNLSIIVPPSCGALDHVVDRPYGPIRPTPTPPTRTEMPWRKAGGVPPFLFLAWNMIVRIMPVKQPSKRPALVSLITLDCELPIYVCSHRILSAFSVAITSERPFYPFGSNPNMRRLYYYIRVPAGTWGGVAGYE